MVNVINLLAVVYINPEQIKSKMVVVKYFITHSMFLCYKIPKIRPKLSYHQNFNNDNTIENNNNIEATTNHLNPSLLLSLDFLSFSFRNARKPISKNIIAITKVITKDMKKKLER